MWPILYNLKPILLDPLKWLTVKSYRLTQPKLRKGYTATHLSKEEEVRSLEHIQIDKSCVV